MPDHRIQIDQVPSRLHEEDDIRLHDIEFAEDDVQWRCETETTANRGIVSSGPRPRTPSVFAFTGAILRLAVQGPPSGDNLASGDAAILWYGINRSNREPAVPSETPRGQLRNVTAGLAQYRKTHAVLLQYIRTTKDDLRHRIVQRQACDAYQWALLISTHEQRHILQIREVKADQRFPRK